MYITKDREKYRQILIHRAIPSGTRLIGKGFILGHDNDPKHTANTVKAYLQRISNKGKITIMEWPSQSPDLNPIENLWNIVKMKRKGIKALSAEDLFQKVSKIWREISTETLNKLVESMPRRIEAVIRNNGGHIKY